MIDGQGNMKASAPIEFQAEFKWLRIRSSKNGQAGEPSQPSYEQRRGTVVEFLDDFEASAMRKFPHHRFTIMRQKDMAAQFERNRGPGWVQSDVDFAMDGTIPPPGGVSVQSDHWSPMSFTLFVQVVSWLETDAWVKRSGNLPLHAAVTVEPASASVPGATEPAKGSYWAQVVALPSAADVAAATDPEQLKYGVCRHGLDGDSEPELEFIERRYLRHRKLQTKVFAHVSDDKTHDSHRGLARCSDLSREDVCLPGGALREDGQGEILCVAHALG